MPSLGIFLQISEDLLVLSLVLFKKPPVLFETATEIDAGGEI